VIDGSDLTVEAATAKLGFLLDRGHRGEDLRVAMERNLVGERA
jgi:L-asparaginase